LIIKFKNRLTIMYKTLNIPSPVRRRLLQTFAASGLLAAVERNQLMAQTAPDYKALICINLEGGNDGDNTVLRLDNTGYSDYARVRTAASGINIAQNSLLPIQPSNAVFPLGLHPSCPTFKSLFDQKKLAIVANMGVLRQPSTKVTLENGTGPRPNNLFSHIDQNQQQQSADARGQTNVGWGGRLADKLEAYYPTVSFPAMTSIRGLSTFTSGVTSVSLALNDYPGFTLPWPGDSKLRDTRDAAINELLLTNTSDNLYGLAARLLAEEGLAASSVIHPILINTKSVVTPLFANINSSISRQLKIVALVMEGREQLKINRQVFYTRQNGYDTHSGQLGVHATLLKDLNDAIAAFNQAMSTLGLSDKVTLFTLSDFGRALKPAAGNGTDHGWGNYAFVMGGAVKGGQLYGTLPTLALDGPDDLGKSGRWIPTTSLEQYVEPLLKWMGVAATDIPYILPNVAGYNRNSIAYL
jgi:uncharacterized protein (DUF1501 family)